MGNFVKHTNCEKCGSSDGLAIYEDSSCHCFVCGYTIASEELKKENKPSQKVRKEKIEDMEIKPSTKPAITEEENQEIKNKTVIQANGFRGIRDETYKVFGVRHTVTEDGDVTEQFYPITQEGQLSGYKIREIPKNFRSKGRTGADCELFMQFKFNRGGKYVVITEGECLLPTTKVLTRKGWVSLEDYEFGEVMQATGEFAEPIAKVYKNYDGEMLKYRSGSYCLDLTPDHNMVRIDKKHGLIKTKAYDLTQKHKPVPRTVNFQSDSDNLLTRLQVMFSADFTFRKGGDIYGCLKKQRKIDRAKMLLDKAGVRYSANLDKRGYTSFFIHRGHGLDVSKEFSYERDLPNAATIVEEVLFWDGNSVPNRQQIEYSSTIRFNAEFVQTCAHLSGFVSSIITKKSEKYLCYKVSILYKKQNSSTQNGFTTYSYSGKVACLTMPHGTLLVKQGDSISITGNCDSLSAYQMISDYNKSKNSDYETAVVSPTTGANSKKQIAAQYKFLDSFENIILMYDSDKAGQTAAEELVKHLPKGKVKIAKLRYKDPNEYLMNGKEREFISDFYSAKTFVPVGVLASGDLHSRIIQQTEIAKVPFPPFMKKLNEMFIGGMPLGYIFNIAADTGIGKTTYVNEMIYYWIFNSPHKVGIVSMELDAGQYGEVLLSRHISRKLSLMPDVSEKLKYLESDFVKQKSNELMVDENGNDRFYLLDNRDGTIEEIQDTIEELVVACNCKVIIIDPLQDLLDGLSNEEQAVFMKWAKGFIKSHGITFVLINHMRKSENSGEMDIMGSSTIIKSAAANILLKRDKLAEDPVVRNTTFAFVPKNRVCGLTGPAGASYYDNNTHTLYDLDDYLNGNA